MGFWGSFLGTSLAHICNEIQNEKKANQKWNDLFFEISDYEEQFTNWLRTIGCDAVYCFDVKAVDNGNIMPEKRKIDTFRNKMEEYISLGGDPSLIHQIDDLDDAIEMVKYLKEKGCLHRQSEFAGVFWVADAKETIEREEELKYKHINEKTTNFEINNTQTFSGLVDALEPKIKDFFIEKWGEFESEYYTFCACLDDLIETTDLYKKITVLNTIISGLKLYESYLMASKMPSELQTKMFTEIINTMDIGKYKRGESEKIYDAMFANSDGLRDDIESTINPSDDYAVGMIWTFLVTACDEISDFSYICDLLAYHEKYLIALGACVQCFTDNDILNEVTIDYCGDVHSSIRLYIDNKCQ